MTDHVLSYRPDCPPQLAQRRINTRLREAYDRRLWGGLLVRGQLVVPAVYTTGTVALTQNSTAVTGTATNWPSSDKVNTTLSAATTIVNELQDITPASMSGIELGDFLVIQSSSPLPETNQEIVLVSSVGATSFQATPTKTHAAGSTITASSFVNRQFRRGTNTSYYTIRAVLPELEPTLPSTSVLILDLPWGHGASAGSAYQILKVYYAMEPGLRMVWSVLSHAQGWRLRLNLPREPIDIYDAWRTSQGFSYAVIDYRYSETGQALYELYPAPTVEQAFPYLAYSTPRDLVDDSDTAPPCIPSHMLVNGAIADVLLFDRTSKYYDPTASAKFNAQAAMDLEAAVMVDDQVYLQNVSWSYGQYPFTQHGADYRQSHDIF